MVFIEQWTCDLYIEKTEKIVNIRGEAHSASCKGYISADRGLLMHFYGFPRQIRQRCL